jgi:Tol biopolymer transport system component
MGRRAVLAGIVVVAVLAVAVPLSRATFPGRNGLLVYEAKVGKHYQLFTIAADGSGERQLTRFTDSDGVWAEWSPDGKRLVFERDVYKGAQVIRALIETMNADGSSLHAVRATGFNGRPSWSPDGKRIVYSTLDYGKKATVTVMAANGTGVKTVIGIPLPEKTFQAKGSKGLDSPSFSPDGKRIAFVWRKKAGPAAIYTINTSGGSPRQVTRWEKWGLADKIDLSPDGSRIAFSSPDPGAGPGISANVFTVHTNGGATVKLTKSRGGKVHNGFDSWSPDGHKIAFVSNRAGTYEIYTMNANGSGITQLTHGPEAHHAAWGIHP